MSLSEPGFTDPPGQDPVPGTITEEPLLQYGWAIALLALVAELVPWRRGPPAVPVGARPAAGPGARLPAVALLPLALDVALLWLGRIYIPEHFDADLPVLVRMVPEVGLFMVPALVLAAAWGVVWSALVPWL